MTSILKGVDFGDNVTETIINKECKVLSINNCSGEGTMTVYDVFPGVVIIYNDFHMSHCVSEFQANNSNLLCIDHCREGCMEQSLSDGNCYFLRTGELCVDIRKHHAGDVDLPVNHFHGISICFYLPEAEEQMKVELKDFSVNLHDLQEKFCSNQKPYIIKASDEISHIFSELYHVPFKIRRNYFRIKIFELLLYLDALEFDKEKKEKAYFYKDKIEKTKAVQRFLTENMTKYYTIKQLSELFDISETTLKGCFKSVYGTPIFSYMQNFRINTGANMLKTNKNKSVAEIAGLVGYDSPSKFSSAFKKIIGTTPLEYRRYGYVKKKI